jgi:hypothetical protein
MSILKWFASLVLTATIAPALLAESHCPGNVASLPIRILNGYKIVVPVSINHSGRYDFLLDTGTQMTVVGPALADLLHLKTQGAAMVAGAGFNESASFSQLDLLEAGSHSLVNQKVLVYGLLNLRSVDSRIRGILGEDFLEHFDMLIDYAHKLLCLDDSAAMQAGIKGPRVSLLTPGQTQDGRPLSNLRIITARLSGEAQPVRLMLDSGSSIPYLYNTSQRLAPHVIWGASLVGSGANGDQQIFFALPPQKVKIGSIELPEVTFLTLANSRKDSRFREFDGLLTMNLFKCVFISHTGDFVVLQPQ